MSDLLFKPVIAIMSAKLIESLSASFETIAEHINEEMLHNLFVASAKEYSTGKVTNPKTAKPAKPVKVSKAKAKKEESNDEKSSESSSDDEKVIEKPVEKPKKDQSAPKREKKTTKPPCCFEGCDKHVNKCDRLIEGKVYCSRHYALKSKQAAKPQKTEKVEEKQTKVEVQEEKKEQVAHTFDFATQPPMDFEDEESDFWKLNPYGNPQDKLMINSRTNLIFTTEFLKKPEIVSPLFGILDEGNIIPLDLMDPSILSWVRNCNISVPNKSEASKIGEESPIDDDEKSLSF
jgi:hypothetical protein